MPTTEGVIEAADGGAQNQPGAPRRGRRDGELSAALAIAVRRLDRFRDRALVPEPYEQGHHQLRRLLAFPTICGFVGSLLVVWGASQPTSPFTLNYSDAGTLNSGTIHAQWATWFFGTGPLHRGDLFFLIGVVAVYVGMGLLIRAWFSMIHITRLHPGIPVARLAPVFVIWVLPLLVVAPLFSHDVYSYVAQGEEASRGINPYKYPPLTLGQNANPYAYYTDSVWFKSTSPYGPVFLWLGGEIMRLVNHSELGAVVAFRVLALAGVILIAVFTPRLARSYGFDGGKAFVLAALNPIVLFHLVAGEHNDAIMMGLAVAGLSISRERYKWAPVAGVVLCTLGALVKAPAELGVVFIGWDWLGEGVPIRRRFAPTAGALALSGVVAAVVTGAVGFGWGWITALKNPGTVHSWMDPATGLGDLLGRIGISIGLGDHTSGFLLVCKLAFALAGVALCARWLLKADGGAGSMRALGLCLGAVVVFSPVVQPWYFVWAAVPLAVVAEKRLRVGLVGVAVVASFLGLPGGKKFVSELASANLVAIFSSVFALLLVAGLLFGPEIRTTLADNRRLTASDRLEAETSASGAVA